MAALSQSGLKYSSGALVLPSRAGVHPFPRGLSTVRLTLHGLCMCCIIGSRYWSFFWVTPYLCLHLSFPIFVLLFEIFSAAHSACSSGAHVGVAKWVPSPLFYL